MKKVLTISECGCGGKPTGYAIELNDESRETIERHIVDGLTNGWGISGAEADSALIDEDIDTLKESGYTYIPGDGVDKAKCHIAEGRFLVEVTILD